MSNTPDQDKSPSEVIVSLLMEDRAAARRASMWKAALVAVITSIYGLGFLASTIGGADSPGEKDYVAKVKLTGPIGTDSGFSAAVAIPLLDKAFNDKDAKGVLIVLNSPGGTPVQSSLIYEHIQARKKETHKKVVVVAEDTVASGAYFVAAAADSIVVNRSSIVGSIGVISAGFGFTDLMNKVGVERRVTTAGTSKNLLDPFSPKTPEGTALQTQLLHEIHEHFIDSVKQGRGDRLHLDTPDLFSGKVWTGKEAVEIGLADELGTEVEAAQRHFGTSTLVRYSPKPTLMEMLNGGQSLKLDFHVPLSLSTTFQ